MNTFVVASVSTSLLSGMPSAAVSPEAGFIRAQLAGPQRSLQRSTIFGRHALFAELQQVAEECATSGWDGFDAVAVSPAAVDQAQRFARALPFGAITPTIGAEPDGHLTFEWYSSPRRIVSVSVSPHGELHYAAIIGPGRQYGVEPFLGPVPTAILELIRRATGS